MRTGSYTRGPAGGSARCILRTYSVLLHVRATFQRCNLWQPQASGAWGVLEKENMEPFHATPVPSSYLKLSHCSGCPVFIDPGAHKSSTVLFFLPFFPFGREVFFFFFLRWWEHNSACGSCRRASGTEDPIKLNGQVRWWGGRPASATYRCIRA